MESNGGYLIPESKYEAILPIIAHHLDREEKVILTKEMGFIQIKVTDNSVGEVNGIKSFMDRLNEEMEKREKKK